MSSSHAVRGLTMNLVSHAHRIIPTCKWLTKTFFALQMRQARFLTVPSACTTSGANSIPNLAIISPLSLQKLTNSHPLTSGVLQRSRAWQIYHGVRPGCQKAPRVLKGQPLGRGQSSSG